MAARRPVVGDVCYITRRKGYPSVVGEELRLLGRMLLVWQVEGVTRVRGSNDLRIKLRCIRDEALGQG